MKPRLVLQLLLPFEWDQIDVIHQAVVLCVSAVFGKSDLNDALAMVSSELLENAIKHGKRDAPVRLAVEELPDGLMVLVTNELDTSNAQTKKLGDRIAWIQSFANPRDAYLATVEKAFAEGSQGGLGLPRIAYEGHCIVGCDTSVEGLVTVTALLPMKKVLAYAEAIP